MWSASSSSILYEGLECPRILVAMGTEPHIKSPALIFLEDDYNDSSTPSFLHAWMNQHASWCCEWESQNTDRPLISTTPERTDCLVLTVWKRRARLPQHFHNFPDYQLKFRDWSRPRNAYKFELARIHTMLFFSLSKFYLKCCFRHILPLGPCVTTQTFLSVLGKHSWPASYLGNSWAGGEG